jgi:hypothetical protein
MSVALVPQRPSAHTCNMRIFKSGEGLGIEGELEIEQSILGLSDVRG